MTFLAPQRLWLLALPVVLAAAYVVAQRARRRYAVRFTNLELLASVAPKRPGWRRHLTACLLLAAIALLTVGFAQPAVERRVPKEQATLILALDVSTSMSATDVAPSRLAAAQSAARDFAGTLPQPVRLGLVAFAGTASVVVTPTADRAAVRDAISRLTLSPSTAIGEAIYASLAAIDAERQADSSAIPAHVVLMSDGTTTVGRPNAQATAAAVTAAVPITTIAYGTDDGAVTVDNRLIPVPVDRAALREIAAESGGTFFQAADADQLSAVYDDIGRAVSYETTTQEVTDLAVGAALVALTAAAAGSLFWLGRLP